MRAAPGPSRATRLKLSWKGLARWQQPGNVRRGVLSGAVTIDWTSPGTLVFVFGFVVLPALLIGWALWSWRHEQGEEMARDQDQSADEPPRPKAS